MLMNALEEDPSAGPPADVMVTDREGALRAPDRCYSQPRQFPTDVDTVCYKY